MKQNAPAKPPCPGCGNKSQRSILQIADTLKCGRCGALYDFDPDEGGSHYSDPAKRLEKYEQTLARKQNGRQRFR